MLYDDAQDRRPTYPPTPYSKGINDLLEETRQFFRGEAEGLGPRAGLSGRLGSRGSKAGYFGVQVCGTGTLSADRIRSTPCVGINDFNGRRTVRPVIYRRHSLI